MKNIVFKDEYVTENDLYFMCCMIEQVARRIHRPNKYVVNNIPKEEFVLNVPTSTQMGKVYKRLILATI